MHVDSDCKCIKILDSILHFASNYNIKIEKSYIIYSCNIDKLIFFFWLFDLFSNNGLPIAEQTFIPAFFYMLSSYLLHDLFPFEIFFK